MLGTNLMFTGGALIFAASLLRVLIYDDHQIVVERVALSAIESGIACFMVGALVAIWS